MGSERNTAPGSHRYFLRNARAGGDLEVFLVTAVSAILLIRFALRMSGYPKLGGDALHIAHMLWGGLLMLAAFVILLSFLDRGARRVAAFVAGAGFGTFIDEVGKFVTHDNDYFYQPSVAIMYGIFVVLFVAVRTVHQGRSLGPTEHLLNAIQGLEEVALGDLDQSEKRRALHHLDHSDPAHPLVAELRASLGRTATVPTPTAGRLVRLRRSAATRYRDLTAHRLFVPGLITFFALQAILRVIHAAALIRGWRFETTIGADGGLTGHLTRRLAGLPLDPGLMDWVRMGTTLLSGGFVVAGIFLLRRSRLRAYAMFRVSVLVTIFLTEVMVFYEEEFAALVGLAFNVLVLAALGYVSRRER